MILSGKKAIVTGANKNIGTGIAIELAKAGADVCIHYRSDKMGAESVAKAIQAMGRKSIALQADFTEPGTVDAFLEKATSSLEGIDILVNNAGGYDTSSFLDLSSSTFKSLIDIGVLAPMQFIQKAAQKMIKSGTSGAIINISSISGLRPYLNRVAHSTAKAALNMLTQSTALELASFNIRVNGICPGPVPEGETEISSQDVPLKRLGKPEDIAKAVLYLASDDSSWITGHILVVDGGRSLSF